MNEMHERVMAAVAAALVAGVALANGAFHPCVVRGRTHPGAWVVSNCGQIAHANEKGWYEISLPVQGVYCLKSMSDIQVIDRGGFKFVCCANMGDGESRRAVMKIFVPERNARFRMLDPVCGKAIGTFTSAELAAGVPLELPPQEHVLRVLTELTK